MHLLLLLAVVASAPTLPEIERESIAGHDLAVLRMLSAALPALQRTPRAALLRESAATRIAGEARALLHDGAAIGATVRAVVVLAASESEDTRDEAAQILATADRALVAYPNSRRYAAFLRSIVLGVPIADARPLHQPWMVIASNTACDRRRNALVANLPAGGNVVGTLRFTNERCDDDGWYADVEIRVGDVARWGTFDAARPHTFAGLATPMLLAVHAHARAQIARARVLLARDRILDAEEALLAAALSLPVRPPELEQLLTERHGIAVPLLGIVASRSPFGPFPWTSDWHRVFRLPVMAVPPQPALPPRPPAIEPPDGLSRAR